jgi:hypothetical protein
MKAGNPDTLIERIKRQAIIAVFSNDDLMDRLVLKGGNLLDLVYQISTRASKDLDFSMEGEFSSVDELRTKLSPALTVAFREIGFEMFDLDITLQPPKLTEDRKHFWGGYRVYFKLIESEKARSFPNEDSLRRNAVPLGSNNSTRFRIDISKHEYCPDRRQHTFDGYAIYTYSPSLFVAEKLRAICQQHLEYARQLQHNRTARARDFVDICTVIDQIGINTTSKEFHNLVAKVFAQKMVPLTLLGRIEEDRDFHRPDFTSVVDTVKPGVQLRDFDDYFDRVVALAGQLESFRDM